MAGLRRSQRRRDASLAVAVSARGELRERVLAGLSCAFGVSLGILGYFLRDHQDIILKISGTLLIVMGLHLSGVITIPFLEQERRSMRRSGSRIGYARSFVVGSTFSAGWSPCIGPTLGAILGLAVSSGTVAEAGVLLLIYSLGLSVPFLAMGLAYNGVKPVYERVKRYSGWINYVSGAMLIVVGILVSRTAWWT